MKPIIHIGYPKTATTWFQNVFFPNIIGINYIDKRTVNKTIVNSNISDFEEENILKKLKIETQYQIILSSETIIGTINEGWKKGANLFENSIKLKKLFPEATIIIFLRNQVELIASAYIQYIKNGGNYSIDKYLNSESLFSFEHLEFETAINQYINLFRDDNIHIYFYEDFTSNKLLFLEQFKQRYNLDINLETLNMNEVNSRIKSNFILLKRISNCFSTKNKTKYKYHILYVPYLSKTIDFLVEKLSSSFLAGKKISSEKILGKQNIEKIKDYYKKTNENLCNIVDSEKLKKYNYL